MVHLFKGHHKWKMMNLDPFFEYPQCGPRTIRTKSATALYFNSNFIFKVFLKKVIQ